MLNHLSPGQAHALLAALDQPGLTVTLERQVDDDGMTDIARGLVERLDDAVVVLRDEDGARVEAPLTEIVRITVEV